MGFNRDLCMSMCAVFECKYVAVADNPRARIYLRDVAITFLFLLVVIFFMGGSYLYVFLVI